MITQAFYFVAALGVAAGCAWSFQRARAERGERSAIDWSTAAPIERVRDARELAQSYGRSALAVGAGGWAVLVALSCALNIAMGRV